MIRVTDFHKSFRKTVAVRGLTFDVPPGRILGLVGPNGAGKTTTMRVLAGIIPPSGGRLLVNGHAVVTDPIAAKRRLAYVPDDPRLFDMLTVWEHLEFIASAYGVADFDGPATDLLTIFELQSNRDTLAHELSRGMRQKVAICCSYLHDSGAILFDEPLTGLDPRGICTVKQSIVDRAAGGAAVVISSHMLALVDVAAKCLLLAAACCLAVILGAVTYRAAGQSWALCGLVAWLVLSLAAIATLPCVGWAYRRFDVSLHSPQ